MYESRITSVFVLFFVIALSASTQSFALGGGTGMGYEATGQYATVRESGGGSCTVYRPRELADNHPVILWGNGTGASPSSYSGLLTHWASWGFVVVAANTPNAGTGRDMLQCLTWLEQSSLAGAVDFAKVGTSGHSQGGGGSIMAGTDPRIAATAPIQGYTLGLGHDRSSHNKQSGPMLILSGSADTLVNPQLNHGSLFQNANVPVFWAILRGASHFAPVGNGGGFRGIATAWFLYQLSGSTDAAAFFEGSDCVYCVDSNWEIRKKNIP